MAQWPGVRCVALGQARRTDRAANQRDFGGCPIHRPTPPFFRPNVSQPQLLGGRVKVVDALHASSVNYSISPGFVLFCFLGSTVRIDGGRGPMRRNTLALQQRPAASSAIGFANPRAVRSITACCWPVVLARISPHTLLQVASTQIPHPPRHPIPGPPILFQSCSLPPWPCPVAQRADGSIDSLMRAGRTSIPAAARLLLVK